MATPWGYCQIISILTSANLLKALALGAYLVRLRYCKLENFLKAAVVPLKLQQGRTFTEYNWSHVTSDIIKRYLYHNYTKRSIVLKAYTEYISWVWYIYIYKHAFILFYKENKVYEDYSCSDVDQFYLTSND